MDYDKLIERLRTDSLYADKASLEIMDLCMDAATAIETLRSDLARVTAERDGAQARLAEISGVIGSAPITAAFGVPLERIRELLEADREKRCVVLSCKKGDAVWRIVHDATPHITKDRCTNIKVENGKVWISLIGDRVMGGWDFGKLLFLSEKEAIAALKAREQDG